MNKECKHLNMQYFEPTVEYGGMKGYSCSAICKDCLVPFRIKLKRAIYLKEDEA